ncbi:MAG TPA: DNA polymerase III subunit gamma/tau [Candidatus Avacidaminococcus intestinavium]|uniref:DNA-directed DNA polymerase n=1 Tax=Candidatus Avacidaminococcus intestinavium TaxID=2840684 RepID=A0A9D1MR08_9FIRM|nr:DNA polymerase III subunit gamma/tau [Candidatus Avacidaminococcus intestinavium]
MNYVALYRRFRPQNFEGLVGQDHIRTTLTHALAMGKIAHAYLFTGPRGTGKTSTARIMAKALNCELGPTAEPCNKCENCLRATEGSSMDIFEIDAASNRGIDEIRQLREKVAFAPVNGRYKIYIIDEVHMMTNDAFNALLKTLEEPPAHVIFILATTEPHKIPATIHSRCQRFDFHRVNVEEIADHLAKIAEQSGIGYEKEALRLIAMQADGGLRDALSLLDQCAVLAKTVTAQSVRDVLGIVGREDLRKLVRAVGRNDLPQALAALQDLLLQGKDVKQILAEMSDYLRAVLLFLSAPNYEEIYLTETQEELALSADKYTVPRLIAAQQRLHKAMEEAKWAVRDKIAAELCIVDLCAEDGNSLRALETRIEKLEKLLREKPVQQVSVSVSSLSPQVATRNVPVTTGNAQKVKESRENQQPSLPKPVETVTDGTIKTAHTQVTTQETAMAPNDITDGKELWQKALQRIKADKKMSLHACASCGNVASFDGVKMVLAFQVAYSCERMKRADYKAMVETILSDVAKASVAIECVVGSGEVAVKQTDKQLDPSVKKALEVFGGKLEKI